jgi:PEP-CTERM motif
MKKTILTLVVTSLLAITSVPAAITSVLLSFNDNSGTPDALTSNVGTFNFSVNVFLTFTTDGSNPNMLQGLSYWLETENGAASHITLTSETYFTIASQTDPGNNKVFNQSGTAQGADTGFMASHDSQVNPVTGHVDTGDLGGTFAPIGPGTYQVATLNFSVSGLAAGTNASPLIYHIETTHLGNLVSEATNNNPDSSMQDSLIPQAIYTITVVPEPATLSLLGLGALGSFGLTVLRARRKG